MDGRINSSKIENSDGITQFSTLSNNKSGIFLIFFIFFVLFGPKIGSYIDTSIIFSIFGLLIMAMKKSNLIFHKRYFYYVLGVGSILIYTLLIMILNNVFTLEIIGRYVRTIISLLAIWAVIYNSNYSIHIIYRSVVIALALHAITVIFSALNPNIGEYLRWFNGFDKTIREYRSTGLMIGFDMSGLLCIIGFLMTAVWSVKDKSKIGNRVLLLIFIIATLFTSRFSIITLLLLMMIFVLNFRQYRAKRFEVLMCLSIIPVVILPLTILFLSTTDIGVTYLIRITNMFPQITGIVNEIRVAYADYGDVGIENIIWRHFNFESLNLITFIFGLGINPLQDPGYTRTIYNIGLIGLLMSIVWYSIIVKDVLKIIKNNRSVNWYSSRNLKQLKFLVVVMYLIVLLLSLKNNYFFTGTFFELFIIFVVMSYRIAKKGA